MASPAPPSLHQPAGRLARPGEERHPALAQPLAHPRGAGDEPALVEPDQAAIGAEVGQLGDLGEHVDELLEPRGQLSEDLVQAAAAGAGAGAFLGQRAVRPLAHGDVVVDPGRRAGQRVSEEAGDPQGGVAQPAELPGPRGAPQGKGEPRSKERAPEPATAMALALARLVATPKLPKRIPSVLSAEEINGFLDSLARGDLAKPAADAEAKHRHRPGAPEDETRLLLKRDRIATLLPQRQRVPACLP